MEAADTQEESAVETRQTHIQMGEKVDDLRAGLHRDLDEYRRGIEEFILTSTDRLREDLAGQDIWRAWGLRNGF